MDEEGMERQLRRTRKKVRLIAFILLGVALAVVGFVLIIVANAPEATELDQEVFQGVAPPGQQVIPINRTSINGTGWGWVRIAGETLPCGLSIHALTVTQVEIFNETNVVPQGAINCDNPEALVQAAATHVVVHNQDTDESFGYRVRATYFAVNLPFAWLVLPGIALIAIGLILVGVVLIRR